MCVDDWNIDHRWGQKKSFLRGPTFIKEIVLSIIQTELEGHVMRYNG